MSARKTLRCCVELKIDDTDNDEGAPCFACGDASYFRPQRLWMKLTIDGEETPWGEGPTEYTFCQSCADTARETLM